jgi:hypothetical protein
MLMVFLCHNLTREQKGLVARHLWREYLTLWLTCNQKGEKVGAIGLEPQA